MYTTFPSLKDIVNAIRISTIYYYAGTVTLTKMMEDKWITWLPVYYFWPKGIVIIVPFVCPSKLGVIMITSKENVLGSPNMVGGWHMKNLFAIVFGWPWCCLKVTNLDIKFVNLLSTLCYCHNSFRKWARVIKNIPVWHLWRVCLGLYIIWMTLILFQGHRGQLCGFIVNWTGCYYDKSSRKWGKITNTFVAFVTPIENLYWTVNGWNDEF